MTQTPTQMRNKPAPVVNIPPTTAPVLTEDELEERIAPAEAKYPRLTQRREMRQQAGFGPVTPADIHVIPIGLNYYYIQQYVADGYDFCYPGCPYILNQEAYAQTVLPWTKDHPEPTVVLGDGINIYMAILKDDMEARRNRDLRFFKERFGDKPPDVSEVGVKDLFAEGETGTV